MELKSYTSEEMKRLKSETDWERVKNMSDDDIDFSDIPELTDEMAKKAVRYSYGKPVLDDSKTDVNLKLDNNIIDFFKNLGDDWQSKINDTLSQVVKMKNL